MPPPPQLNALLSCSIHRSSFLAGGLAGPFPIIRQQVAGALALSVKPLLPELPLWFVAATAVNSPRLTKIEGGVDEQELKARVDRSTRPKCGLHIVAVELLQSLEAASDWTQSRELLRGLKQEQATCMLIMLLGRDEIIGRVVPLPNFAGSIQQLLSDGGQRSPNLFQFAE